MGDINVKDWETEFGTVDAGIGFSYNMLKGFYEQQDSYSIAGSFFSIISGFNIYNEDNAMRRYITEKIARTD